MKDIIIREIVSCSIKHFLIECCKNKQKDSNENIDYIYFEKKPVLEAFNNKRLAAITDLTEDIQNYLIDHTAKEAIETELTSVAVDIEKNLEGMSNMHLIFIIEAFELLKKNGLRPLMAGCHFNDNIYCSILILLDSSDKDEIRKVLEMI